MVTIGDNFIGEINNMKITKLFGILSLLLILISSTAFATHYNPLDFYFGHVGNAKTSVRASTPGDDFTITQVKVDGLVAGGNAVYVQRGTRVPVDVYLLGTDDVAYDTRVRVYLGGYEYGDVSDLSDIFEVEPGVEYLKRLVLNVPNDLEASDDYTLNIEAFDDDSSVRKTYTVRVQEPRHLVNIFDVVLNPVNNVQAGQYLFATVRVENLGDNIEDTSKVTLSIPTLGVQNSQFVGELVTQELLNEGELSSTRRISATTNDLVVQIPENTQSGDYNVVVRAEFNRGFGVDEKTYLIHVEGAKQSSVDTGSVDSGEVSINVDTTAQRVNQKQGAQFNFAVSNLKQEAQTFDFSVESTQGWAAYNLDPATLTVQSNEVKEVHVFVAPLEGVEGARSLIVKVKSNGNLVAEKQLSVDVVGSSNNFATAKKVLAWVFVVLLVLLVLLALVVVVKKLTENKEGPVEGQTYY